jgi:hypothetical protein
MTSAPTGVYVGAWQMSPAPHDVVTAHTLVVVGKDRLGRSLGMRCEHHGWRLWIFAAISSTGADAKGE